MFTGWIKQPRALRLSPGHYWRFSRDLLLLLLASGASFWLRYQLLEEVPVASGSHVTETRWSDWVRSAAYLGKQRRGSQRQRETWLLSLPSADSSHWCHFRAIIQLIRSWPALIYRICHRAAVKVLKEVKRRTSEEHGVWEWTWSLYGGQRGWCNVMKYNLCGFACFCFFLSSPSPIFFFPSNNQEWNKNAENQGVCDPGKTVGVRKAFWVVFFSIHVSRASWTALCGRFCAKCGKLKIKIYYVFPTIFQWPHRTIQEYICKALSCPVIRGRSLLKWRYKVDERVREDKGVALCGNSEREGGGWW